MQGNSKDAPTLPAPRTELTRRRLLAWSAGASAATVLALRQAVEQTSAADGTPVPVDPDELQRLIDLSRTLCGGGNFSEDRATKLMQIIAGDSNLKSGFDELLATPPVPGQSFGSDLAHATAQTILLYWYVDIFEGEVLPDRSSAYYQLTAWQAMYTPSWAICKSFGGWADAPRTDPLVAANS